MKLTDPLVLALCLNVAGSAAAMAGTEIQGKSVTQRPEFITEQFTSLKQVQSMLLTIFLQLSLAG